MPSRYPAEALRDHRHPCGLPRDPALGGGRGSRHAAAPGDPALQCGLSDKVLKDQSERDSVSSSGQDREQTIREVRHHPQDQIRTRQPQRAQSMRQERPLEESAMDRGLSGRDVLPETHDVDAADGLAYLSPPAIVLRYPPFGVIRHPRDHGHARPSHREVLSEPGAVRRDPGLFGPIIQPKHQQIERPIHVMHRSNGGCGHTAPRPVTTAGTVLNSNQMSIPETSPHRRTRDRVPSIARN